MKKYSYEFKAQAVEKALNRGSDVSFNSVAYSCGIDYSTLRRWISQFENQSYGEGIMNEEKSPQLWSAENAASLRSPVEEVWLNPWIREKIRLPIEGNDYDYPHLERTSEQR